MTPLAQKIIREATLPIGERRFADRLGLIGRLRDAHCFDVTEIMPTCIQLMTAGIPRGVDGSGQLGARVLDVSRTTSFLPAPRTWIEWAVPNARKGVLLEDQGNYATARVASWLAQVGFHSGSFVFSFGMGAKGLSPMLYGATRPLTSEEEKDMGEYIALFVGILAFINTPKMIGRQQHQPHKGLERKLRALPDVPVGFHLRPWTEIKLHVTPPEGAGDGQGMSGPLTGQRALHFCRSHLRLRNGRLETVRAHWRGNAAAGIRQSRYKVEA